MLQGIHISSQCQEKQRECYKEGSDPILFVGKATMAVGQTMEGEVQRGILLVIKTRGEQCCWHLVNRGHGCCQKSYNIQGSPSQQRAIYPVVLRLKNLNLLYADQIFDFRRLHDRSNGKTNKPSYIHSKACVFKGSKETNYGKKRTNKAINLKVSQNMESFTFVTKQRCFAFETS